MSIRFCVPYVSVAHVVTGTRCENCATLHSTTLGVGNVVLWVENELYTLRLFFDLVPNSTVCSGMWEIYELVKKAFSNPNSKFQ